METFIILAIIVVALFFGVRWAIRFVRHVTAETGHGFLSIPFWVLLGSFFLAVYVGFTASNENWIAIVVFGAIAIAGILNVMKIGFKNGLVFTLLQCIAIYCSVIAFIFYMIFKGAKGSQNS